MPPFIYADFEESDVLVFVGANTRKSGMKSTRPDCGTGMVNHRSDATLAGPWAGSVALPHEGRRLHVGLESAG